MRLFPNKSSVVKTRNQQKRLKADPEKVKAVQNFPVPQKQTDVKSFLGLCSYYRGYIKNFAMIARPLHKASETKSSLTWTDKTQEAFESFKKQLSTTPILAFPDIKEPFILHTDSSLTALGAVLAQVQDGKERAICYALWHFQNHKQTILQQNGNF